MATDLQGCIFLQYTIVGGGGAWLCFALPIGILVFMTKAVLNHYLFYESSVIMVRTKALFNNFGVAWINLPPPPKYD